MRRLAVGVALVAVAVMLMAASPAWAIYTITPNCVVGGQSVVCGSAWYVSPVELYWTWLPAGGTAAPNTCVTQSFSTDTSTEAACDVSGPDGSGSGGQPIHIEISSPTATVAPNRAPDSNGWYNHAVTGAVSFASFSGMSSCTSTTYSGAATTSATVGATCLDNAGKTVNAVSAPFAYDATAPTLTVAANPGDQNVALSWQAGGDVAPIASVQVTRSDGPTVYDGTGTNFNDAHVKNGAHYTYTITARDVAGNVTTQTVGATPNPRLLSPALGAHVSTPPMLSWTAAPGATYYNVQLFRADPKKVLSMWPKLASLQLRRTWRFDGRRFRLKPGKYRWYVWPGFGKRKVGRYGHMIGSGTFVVVR